jgi:hypothetical protein
MAGARQDVVDGLSAVAAAGTFTIQPPGTEEWSIQNIYYSAAVDIYKTDGVNTIKIDNDSISKLDYNFNVRNGMYLTVVTATAQNIGFDGIRLKP